MAKRTVKEPRFQVIDPDTSFGNHGVPQPEVYLDLNRAYGMHVWVYKCVNVISQSIAAIEFLPYLQKKDDSWLVNESHEFFPLLKKPNPYMTGYNLIQYTVAALKLTGNAFWALERLGTNEIKEIWPLIPSNVKVISSKNKMIDGYVYTVGGKETFFAYDEVIQFKDMNPESFLYGLGALSSAKNAVATDIFAQVWNKSFFKNSARPAATLETDKVLSDPVRKRVRRSWEEMYGGANNQGKTALLEQGLKYKQVSESTKDMDFVNLRKDLRIEVLAAFGVPPSLVGLLEYANYSNMEQQSKMFWENTLIPVINLIEQTMTLRFNQISFDTKGTVFQADMSKVKALRPDMKMLAETYTAFVNGGIPPNQIIDALDLPFEHIEGGDSPRQPPQSGFAPNVPGKAAPKRDSKDLSVSSNERELGREVEWKRFDGRVRDEEAAFASSMRGFFAGQKRRILKALDERARTVLHTSGFRGGEKKKIEDTVALFFDLQKENDLMKKPADRFIRGTYFDFAVSMAQKIDPAFNFSLTDPYAEDWIAKKVSKLVRGANEYTMESITKEVADAVQEAVAEGFSESETIAQVVDRINAVYEFANETRAERIARTEIIGAANAGSFEAMKKTGVQKKEWLSSRDEKVRETHKAMDGQTAGISEAFLSPSGATLQYPGDPSGPAEEVIQCRCTPLPVVELG
jgi:HK97 family phage portal protein